MKTESKPSFYYFENHGNEEGTDNFTIIYGDQDDYGNGVITGAEDNEEQAAESCKRLNSIISNHKSFAHKMLLSDREELLKALERIANWELPHTGQFWDDGTPISFEANQGSNGVRDYIKSIAQEAIQKHRKQ